MKRAKILQNLFGNASVLLGDSSAVNYQENSFTKIFNKLSHELKQMAQLNDPQGVYSFCLACEIE